MRCTDVTTMRVLMKIVFIMTLMHHYSVGAKSTLEYEKHRKTIKKKYGHKGAVRIENALKLTHDIRSLSDRKKLEKVNRFVNRVYFVTDQSAWGKTDYWATPVEFLGRNRGDCEDFVITKYFMLRKAGVSSKKLFFTYVKALKFNQAHMVLSYYDTPKSVPLVLDNLNYKVLPASQRKDLAFVYSFNAQKLYLNRQKGLGKVVPGGRNKNKKWATFLEKIEKEF